jgi:hypothetical protein
MAGYAQSSVQGTNDCSPQVGMLENAVRAIIWPLDARRREGLKRWRYQCGGAISFRGDTEYVPTKSALYHLCR